MRDLVRDYERENDWTGRKNDWMVKRVSGIEEEARVGGVEGGGNGDGPGATGEGIPLGES